MVKTCQMNSLNLILPHHFSEACFHRDDAALSAAANGKVAARVHIVRGRALLLACWEGHIAAAQAQGGGGGGELLYLRKELWDTDLVGCSWAGTSGVGGASMTGVRS